MCAKFAQGVRVPKQGSLSKPRPVGAKIGKLLRELNRLVRAYHEILMDRENDLTLNKDKEITI
jgi:hypothetical protein